MGIETVEEFLSRGGRIRKNTGAGHACYFCGKIITDYGKYFCPFEKDSEVESCSRQFKKMVFPKKVPSEVMKITKHRKKLGIPYCEKYHDPTLYRDMPEDLEKENREHQEMLDTLDDIYERKIQSMPGYDPDLIDNSVYEAGNYP